MIFTADQLVAHLIGDYILHAKQNPAFSSRHHSRMSLLRAVPAVPAFGRGLRDDSPHALLY
jgi:hypothetical protein